jgi:DNA-binding beta-propeller fold protein YncE
MWVALTGNTVTELSASGASLGTFAVATAPCAISFDGTNVWLANCDESTVTELSPAGATIGTYPVGLNPLGLAFDGMHMWVASTGVVEL